MDVLNIKKEPPKYTIEDSENTFIELQRLSFIVNNVTIDKDYKLTEDMHTYGSLYIKSGTVDLNGYILTVCGNIYQTGGTMKINSGKLNIGGTYTLEGNNTYLNMTNEDDYIKIDGDLIAKSGSSNGKLTNGTIEVKGNFQQLYAWSSQSFDATGNHKVIFCGTDEQHISFATSSASGFANVDFKNPNIVFDTDIRGFILNRDTILNSTEIGVSNALDLNGYTLSFTGNLLQTHGTMKINSGKLNIGGTYTLEGNNTYLNMTNEDDYIKIDGDLIAKSGSSNGKLTNGTIEVKGNFQQLYAWSSQSFDATGNHKVIFCGTDEQHISFATSPASGFANVDFKNPNIVFDTDIRGFTLSNGEYVFISNKGQNDTYISFDLCFSDTYPNSSAIAIMALYDKNGKLLKTEFAPITIKTRRSPITFSYNNISFDAYKLMVWENTSNLKPLCNALTVSK